MSIEGWDTDPGMIAANRLNPQATIAEQRATIAELVSLLEQTKAALRECVNAHDALTARVAELEAGNRDFAAAGVARIKQLEAALRDVLTRLECDGTRGDYTRAIRSCEPAKDGSALNAARAALRLADSGQTSAKVRS